MTYFSLKIRFYSAIGAKPNLALKLFTSDNVFEWSCGA